MLRLDGNEGLEMTGWEVYEALGRPCTNHPVDLEITQGSRVRRWVAWATTGRGRNQGSYLHMSTEVHVSLVHKDGTKEPTNLMDRLHVRGKFSDKIRTFQEV